jgi:tetratricopeptide (TPR) repeat protein
VLEQSWRLLSTEEQEAIARLSIFRGKFRQAAAIHITGASLFTVATLVEKALLRVTTDGYYQLHELTRQFAEEQLSSSAQATLRDAHATFYADLLHQHKPRLFMHTFRQVWVEVSSELDNIRHAWQWLIEAAGAGRDNLPLPNLLRQMAEVLTAYHLFHSFWLTGQALFDQACQVLETAGWQHSSDAANGQPSRRAALLKLRICAGQFQFEMGQFRASLAIAEQALTDCRAFGLEDDLFCGLMLYGHTQVGRGAHAAAGPIFQEALARGERLRLPRYRAEALIGLGMIASSQGRYAEAQGHYRQGLVLCKEMGYRPWVARLLTNLGTTHLRQAEYQQALPYYEQALAIAQEEGYQNMILITTSNLGGVYRGFGQYPLALEHYQRSLAMARNLGDSCWMAINLNCIAMTYLAMQQLAAAERTLHEALIAGQQSDSTSDILCSIGLLGHVAAHRGQWEEALKALIFVDQHPATMALDKVYNQSLFADLQSKLPPSLFEQTMSWAAGQTLDDVARWSLRSASLFPVGV